MADFEANDIDHLPTRDGYDRWAAIYDDENNPLITLEEPRVDGLAGDVAGLDVLDLGCGTGRHAVRFAARGARVTAMDFSEAMLATARRKPGAAAVRFVVHDLHEPLPVADRAFDRVVCGLVFEHLRTLDGLFSEMGRACRPGGLIIASAMHPAMMLRGITARFTDPGTARETRPQSHPHQIADFLMAALRAGLVLRHISEHAVDDELVARSPRAAKYHGWPMLLLLEFGVGR